MDLTVHSDDTVSGTVLYAVVKDVMAAEGERPELLRIVVSRGPFSARERREMRTLHRAAV